LKDACTWVTPDWTFLTSRFLRDFVCFLAAKKDSDEFIRFPERRGCRRLDLAHRATHVDVHLMEPGTRRLPPEPRAADEEREQQRQASILP